MPEKRTIGPFELESQLGVGGMGVVYLATYTKTGQKAAVKVLTPAMSSNQQLVSRFEREMEILKKLQHPHIVRYFGGGKSGNQHFYAMELMDGGSVEQLLKKKGKLPWEQAIEIGMQVAKALEHSHNHGIVHRDLKPANLFITKGTRIKLGDFGIARDTEATALTAAGKTVGTYAYMAPEQISGKPPVSGKTDLYALGCVMFELLTGRTPFDGGTPAEMLFQHLQDEPPRVTQFAIDCPIPLEQVVLRLLAKDPEDRYYDALAVQVALEEVGQKVAEQASIAKQTVAGGATAGATQGDAADLAKLLGKKKKKKSKNQPVWERGWFLGASLAVLVGVIAWLMWPLSEEQLFARAEPLMQTENASGEWQSARDRYLKPLLERFPEGKRAGQARDYLDQIDAATKRNQIDNPLRKYEPKTEAERLYLEAREFEKFGDRVTALEKYRSIIELVKGREEDRVMVRLARDEVKRIEDSGGLAIDRIDLVNTSLREADQLLGQGRLLDAQKKWDSVITLYAANKEFESQVKYARARRAGVEPEPLDLAPRNPETPDAAEPEGKPAAG